MRSLLLLYFLSFGVNASFKVNVIDTDGLPVADAVVSLPAVQLQETRSSGYETLPTAVMDQVGMQFEPHVLVVSRQQSVRFPNSDDTRHHVYSFSEPKVFELKLFKGSDSNPVVMDTPGIVELGCNIHDKMLGFIYVDNTGSAVKTNILGEALLQGTPPKTLTVWHPRLNHAKGELKTIAVNEVNVGKDITLYIDLLPQLAEAPIDGFKSRFRSSSSKPGF